MGVNWDDVRSVTRSVEPSLSTGAGGPKIAFMLTLVRVQVSMCGL